MNDSAIAGQTAFERSMFPWTLNPAPSMSPQWGMQAAPARRGATHAVDERHLAHVAQRVLENQLVQRLARRAPALHQRQPARPVAALGEGLRRDHPDAG